MSPDSTTGPGFADLVTPLAQAPAHQKRARSEASAKFHAHNWPRNDDRLKEQGQGTPENSPRGPLAAAPRLTPGVRPRPVKATKPARHHPLACTTVPLRGSREHNRIAADMKFLKNANHEISKDLQHMGFGVPAALAAPDRRPIVLVGDGGFQMTGMELATLIRYKLDAIVIVLNNGGYRSLEALGADPKFCRIHPWDYVVVAQALGAGGTRVHSLDEFTTALRAACSRKRVSLIEVVLSPDDISLPLRRLRESIRPTRLAT